jgi:hypothetical protein
VTHNQLQEQYTLLRDENTALQIQLANTKTPEPDEKLMEQDLDLRQELAASRAAMATVQAEVVQAVDLRSGMTPGSGTSFNINPRHLPIYHGTGDTKAIVDFWSDIKRAFALRCHEIGWLRDDQPEEDGWSPYAIARLRWAAGR